MAFLKRVLLTACAILPICFTGVVFIEYRMNPLNENARDQCELFEDWTIGINSSNTFFYRKRALLGSYTTSFGSLANHSGKYWVTINAHYDLWGTGLHNTVSRTYAIDHDAYADWQCSERVIAYQKQWMKRGMTPDE